MTSKIPLMATRWARAHPVALSALAFVAMGPLALLVFQDYRGALAGAAYAAVLGYLWVRPGGIGYRIEAHQQRELAERGDLGVRPAWLIKAAVWVLLAFLTAAAIIYLVDRAT